MGGITPVWGIRYPFQSEVENASHFLNFANDVDAALDLLVVSGAAAVDTAHVIVTRSSGAPTMTVNTDNSLSFTSAFTGDEDPNTMWDISAPTNIVLPTPGLYAVSCNMNSFSPITTVTSQTLSALVNVAAVLRRKIDRDPALNFVSQNSWVAGVVRCLTAGHVLNFSFRWTGTGGPANQPGSTGFVTRLVDLS